MRSTVRTVGLLFLLLVVSVAPVPAQRGNDTVDGAQLLKDLETLSSDAMEGRLPGTPGGARARAYVEQRFKDVGIEPIGNSYEREFTFSGRGANDTPGVNIVGVIRGEREPQRY